MMCVCMASDWRHTVLHIFIAISSIQPIEPWNPPSMVWKAKNTVFAFLFYISHPCTIEQPRDDEKCSNYEDP